MQTRRTPPLRRKSPPGGQWLAGEFGWKLVGVRGDHRNFRHAASRFIVTVVHPQERVPAAARLGQLRVNTRAELCVGGATGRARTERHAVAVKSARRFRSLFTRPLAMKEK